MKEALLWERLDPPRVRCNLCAHRCKIPEGRTGLCLMRENRGGTLYTRVYGRTISQNVDPIEKKPLYHFHPGSTSFSMATPGCNLRCAWCQNWEICQIPADRAEALGQEATPAQLVSNAQQAGCRSIAYTYTEPTIFFEYALDTARLAREAGVANVFVTNGYMTPEALDMAAPVLDAANVDLKAFRDATYREYVKGRLTPVLESLKALRRLGVWLEVTTLLIPGLNDSEEEVRDIALFLVQELGAHTPWHLSRFFPAHDMLDRPPTPVTAIEHAREIGRRAGLRYVYAGNVAAQADLACPACGRELLKRSGARVVFNAVTPEGTCPGCGAQVDGVGMGGVGSRTS